ncbi:MAG: ABC transporter permease [Firmicutes bacterium]|nr:ABC transporter permease [Bacillota bacterium]
MKKHDTGQGKTAFSATLSRAFPQLLLTLALLVLVIFLSVSSDYFWAWKNFRNILDQCSVYLILSLGMAFVIASGGIDLSVGSVAGMCGVIMAVLMHGGVATYPAILLGIAIGVVSGVVNGVIVALIRVNPFITTLATMTITRGVALILTGGVSIYGFAQSFKWWGTGDIGPLNPPIVLSLLLTLAAFVVMRRTLWGKYSLSLGGNAEALRRSGVRVNLYRISIYAVSGFCAAVAGLIMTARLNSAAPLAGSTYEMDAIAAVVLGGGSLNGGSGSIFGVFIACITLSVLRNGLTLLSIPTYFQQLITGGVILIAIIIAQIRNNRDRSH